MPDNIRAYQPSMKSKQEWESRMKIQNSPKYQTMLQKNIEWLKTLDAPDSNPNNGRVDISVFNAKVAKYGYTPSVEYDYSAKRAVPPMKPDVEIQEQAQDMTNKYFGL